MSTILQKFPDQSIFDRGIQIAEIEYLAGSDAAQESFTEIQTGLLY